MSAEDVPPQVLDYLARHETLTVATASLAGLPHAATIGLCERWNGHLPVGPPREHDGADREPRTRQCRSRSTSTRPTWTKTKGIQGSGEIQRILDPAAVDHAVELFKQRFPMLRATSTADLAFYQVRPTQLTFIDNESNAPGVEDDQQALGMVYRQSLVFSIFRDLPLLEAKSLAARLRPVQVDAGEVVVNQGAPADEFFIIVDGEVEVVRDDGAGPRTVATLRSGQFFGEVAILRDMPRSATVRAVLPTTLLTMAREDFRGLVAQFLATTQDFHQVIQERLDSLARE